MKENMLKHFALGTLAVLTVIGCRPANEPAAESSNQTNVDVPFRAVGTVGMISDIVSNVAGERAQVQGIIGEGVDPHLYKPTRSDVAMTGEITLTGRLLPIGGIKEKVLAAHRNRMTDVLMPEMNRKDIEELPREVRTTMKFHFAETILDALLILFPEKAKAR